MDEIEIRGSARTVGDADRLPNPETRLVSGNGMIRWSAKSEGFSLKFQIRRGKGFTYLNAWIKPGAFPAIVAAMLEGSPKEAEQAFLSAMLKRSRQRAKRS